MHPRHPLTRREFSSLAGFALWGGLAGMAAPVRAAAPARLPLSASLAQELATALRRGDPLVVMASLEGCPFCQVARQAHLQPLLAQGQAVVQVDWKSDRSLADFDGQAATHDAMARRWGIRVAPTLLFFGAGGREVAQRMAGSYLPDFYGAYLEARLEQARRAIRA